MTDRDWSLPDISRRAYQFLTDMAALGVPLASVAYTVPGVGRITMQWTAEGYGPDDEEEDDDEDDDE